MGGGVWNLPANTSVMTAYCELFGDIAVRKEEIDMIVKFAKLWISERCPNLDPLNSPANQKLRAAVILDVNLGTIQMAFPGTFPLLKQCPQFIEFVHN